MDPKLYTLPSGSSKGPRRSPSTPFPNHEPEQLRTYAEDLEASLETNRKLLQDVIGMTLTSIAGTGETAEDSAGLYRKVQDLMQRNKAMNDALQAIIRERNEAQGRALINEQIAHEYQQKEQETTKELEDQLAELDYQVEKRDKIYSELLLKEEYLQREAEIIRKTRDVRLMPLSEDSLKMHNLVEKIRSKLQFAGRELHSMRLKREQLDELSKELYADLSKANAAVRNPINRRTGSEWGHEAARRDFSFDAGQLRDSSSEEDSSLSDHVVLPDKVHIQTQTKPALPTLDLVKLKQVRRRSLQDESFKKPQKTAKEAKLEEELDQLTVQSEETGKKLEELTLRLFDLNGENSKLSQENARLVEEIIAARAIIEVTDQTHVPKARAHVRSSAITGTAVSTLIPLPASGPPGEAEMLFNSECLYGGTET